ncbi:hypothetical protein M0R45_033953 [Rubus argutus]|uniref:DC1 domain-containing protein n=1 Tax=Rubus argutus TaxID=59490 RepID=A0AAW1VPW8_RUBAR
MNGVQHFSHPHPLKISNHPSHVASLCAGCKLICAGSGSIYTCNRCITSCTRHARKCLSRITHPFDQSHVLTLLPTQHTQVGSSHVMRVGKDGSGFSYHCGPCDVDLHMNCASMPLALSPPSAIPPPSPTQSHLLHSTCYSQLIQL